MDIVMVNTGVGGVKLPKGAVLCCTVPCCTVLRSVFEIPSTGCLRSADFFGNSGGVADHVIYFT